MSAIGAAKAQNRVIPCKILNHSQLPNIIISLSFFLVHTVLLSDPSVDLPSSLSGSMSIEVVGCSAMISIQLMNHLEIIIYLKKL